MGIVNVVPKVCQICEQTKVEHNGASFCLICDNHPTDEALWFVYWCYREDPDE